MVRSPCCQKTGLKKGPWTREEDQILVNHIQKHGHGSWRALPQRAGLLRCGKSCRLRWTNYLRPDIKRGSFSQEEERTIIQLHAILGNRWSAIASQLPGRTDNEIKNFWSTRLKKRLLKMGLDPSTHAPIAEANGTASASDPEGSEALALTRHKAQWENARLEAEARLSRDSLLMSSNSTAGYHTNNSTAGTTTMPNDNPPADYFLKLWNSEAGKAFRKENHQPNGGGGGDPHSFPCEIPPSSVSSQCCTSTQNSCGQSLKPKYNDNGFQQCNSASFEWIGDCNVDTSEELSCFADMNMGQTEDKAAEEMGQTEDKAEDKAAEEMGQTEDKATAELGFPELLLDFTDNDDNINNTNIIQSELSAGFQQPPTWPWPELHDDEDYWNNLSFISHASAHR